MLRDRPCTTTAGLLVGLFCGQVSGRKVAVPTWSLCHQRPPPALHDPRTRVKVRGLCLRQPRLGRTCTFFAVQRAAATAKAAANRLRGPARHHKPRALSPARPRRVPRTGRAPPRPDSDLHLFAVFPITATFSLPKRPPCHRRAPRASNILRTFVPSPRPEPWTGCVPPRPD